MTASFQTSQTHGARVGPLIIFILSFFLHLNHGCSARAFANTNTITATPIANKKVCISGGGPCGLFLATLLIQQDPTVQITILERSERKSTIGINAFGIGLGTRLLHSLDAVPGLREKVESVGTPANIGVRIISRIDFSEQMTRFLEHMGGNGKQCQIRFGEGCADIDLEGKEVTTTTGHKIQYDLLIGADGINSAVRRTLVEKRGLKEEHYVEPTKWKALRLPPQPDFDATSFKPLRHPLLRGGRLLPRYPEGHIILAFWNENDGKINPGNFDTAEDLKTMFTDALQDDPPGKEFSKNWKSVGVEEVKDFVGKRREIDFDDKAVDLFLKTRPGRSHYMKVNRFHDDSVALIGDAAHGMNSLLGQGCATGLKCTQMLAEELGSGPRQNLNEALQSYSKRAVREAHAITDLNKVAVTMLHAGPILKALLIPFLMLQKVLGRTIFQSVNKVDDSYERILRENWFLIPFSWLKWRRERRPFPAKA